MKQIFEIKNREIIENMLESIEYGTLAICHKNRPYSIPLNFVNLGDFIYFHGSKKGRKIDILQENSFASFSVVENFSLIASFFSSKDGLACPATQFFKSIIIDGSVAFVEEYEEKVEVMQALMQKLQKEGKYRALDEEVYKKALNATTIYKLTPYETRAKFKFGQHLNRERFEMIIEHLQERGTLRDLQTIEMMKEFKNGL